VPSCPSIKAQKRLANHFDYAHGNLSRKERAHYLSIAEKAPVGGVRLQPPSVQGSLLSYLTPHKPKEPEIVLIGKLREVYIQAQQILHWSFIYNVDPPATDEDRYGDVPNGK